MIGVLALNSLSVVGQAASAEEAEEGVESVVRGLAALNNRFQSGEVSLVFDEAIEQRQLFGGYPLIRTIGNLRNRQARRQWFLYTRNRARRAIGPLLPVTLDINDSRHVDTLTRELALEATHWLSFVGSVTFDSEALTICVEGVAARNIANASAPEVVLRWLPKYVPSLKHGVREYVGPRGVVSAMDLDEIEGSDVLERSISGEPGQRFGFFGGRCYEFRLTGEFGSQAVYHGFVVDAATVPGHIFQRLVAQAG